MDANREAEIALIHLGGKPVIKAKEKQPAFQKWVHWAGTWEINCVAVCAGVAACDRHKTHFETTLERQDQADSHSSSCQ